MNSRSNWDRILSASQKNNAVEIRRLVEEEGVSPSHSNMVGQSTIHVAALWGNISAVMTLISLGAELSAKNQITGGTPLHCLSTSNKKPIANRIECARLLIEAGADPTVTDSYGSMASEYAEDTDVPEPELLPSFPHLRNKSLKQILVEGIPKAPLFDYILRGDVDSVKEFLREGKDKDDLKSAKDSNGNGLIMTTIQLILTHFEEEKDLTKLPKLPELLEVLELLFRDANLDPNVTNKEGESPIFLICRTLNNVYKQNSSNIQNQFLEHTAKMLIQYNASLGSNSILLLHDACRRGNLPMIRFMIEDVHVDKNTKGRQGLTPVHFAARSGKVEALKLLIQLGADVNRKDDRGKTPLDAAVANQKDEIIRILQKHVGDDSPR